MNLNCGWGCETTTVEWRCTLQAVPHRCWRRRMNLCHALPGSDEREFAIAQTRSVRRLQCPALARAGLLPVPIAAQQLPALGDVFPAKSVLDRCRPLRGQAIGHTLDHPYHAGAHLVIDLRERPLLRRLQAHLALDMLRQQLLVLHVTFADEREREPNTGDARSNAGCHSPNSQAGLGASLALAWRGGRAGVAGHRHQCADREAALGQEILPLCYSALALTGGAQFRLDVAVSRLLAHAPGSRSVYWLQL